jgi:hypothetical protein
MTDKDKEAFEKFMGEGLPFSYYEHCSCPDIKAWQAAIEYMRKEYSNIMDAMTRTSQVNAKLQAENAKLKAIVMFASEASCYTEYEDACSLSRRVLKELEER